MKPVLVMKPEVGSHEWYLAALQSQRRRLRSMQDRICKYTGTNDNSLMHDMDEFLEEIDDLIAELHRAWYREAMTEQYANDPDTLRDVLARNGCGEAR